VKLVDNRTEDHQVHLTAEAEPAEVEKALDEAYRRLVDKVEVPGFRKGKAPRDILERQIGEEALFNEAMESFLSQACVALVNDNNIPVYARPQVNIIQKEPLIFEAIIPQPPEVTLGDFSQVKMTPEPVEVKEEEVDRVVERLRKQFATWEIVDREAQMFDMTVIDITSEVDGRTFVNEVAANFQIIPDLPYPTHGFAEQIVGMKADEEKEFTITVADNHEDKSAAGKEAHFKVRLYEVREEKPAELSTAFAKTLSPDFEDMDAVRNTIREDLTAREKDRKRVAFEENVMDALVGISEIGFPPLLVDIEVDRMVQQYVARLRRSLRTDEELKSVLGMTNEEKLRQSYRPRAVQQIKRTLVLAKVSEEQKFAVSDEEINEQIEALSASAGEQKEERRRSLSSDEGKEGVRDWILTRKTINYLAEQAQAE